MDTTDLKGLRLSVYTHPHYRKCSAGGISETCLDVTVVGVVDQFEGTGDLAKVSPMPRDSRVFAPTPTAPAVVLVRRRVGREIWHVAPADAFTDRGQTQHWYAAGGAYVATSDSRISELTGVYGAFALHDRKEW